MARLGDIGKILTGNTPKTSELENYSSNDICFVKPSDVLENEITCIKNSEFYISESARHKARIVPPKSILVTCIGIIGKVAICQIECAFNQQINAIIPDLKKCVPDFVAYAIQYKKEELQNIANAAVVPILNKTQFADIRIDLPPLEKQRNVTAVLGKVSALIFLRKQQLAKLDELVKARFVEMFGDPVQNDKGWPLISIGDIAEIRIGPFGTMLHKEDYIKGGHALVNPSHIVDGKICVDLNLTVSDEKYGELGSYALQVGDVVLGRRGEMGRCAVVYESGLLCGTGSMIIRPSEKMQPYFLQNILSNPTFKKTIEDKAVGVTMMNLNIPIVSSLMIPQLPIVLQSSFIDFLRQVDQQKLTIQQSLDKLEVLKKSLMQEYFK